MSLLNRQEGEDKPTSQASCMKQSTVLGIIGPSSSSPSVAVATALGPFNIPVISHGASCACLSDKKLFPSFLRTIPSDFYQSRALVELVKYFGWTWVGAIRSDDDYGNYGMAMFLQIAREKGVCIEYSEAIQRTYSRERLLQTVQTIKMSTSKVIIAFVSFNDLELLLKELFIQNITGFQWIGTDSWISAKNPSIVEYYKIMRGALGMEVSNAVIPGLKDFLLNVRPSNSAGNTGMTAYWEFLFNCTLMPVENTSYASPCTGLENLKDVNNQYTDLSNIGYTNNVYKAAYAIAYSLHNIFKCNVMDNDLKRTCPERNAIGPLEISHGASCSCLSNKKLFPYFFRTAPSDYHQSVAMAQLAKYFGWTWVGAIRNDDDYGNYGMATFVEIAQKEGICVEYSEAIHRTYPREKILRVVDIIKLSSSKVIIAFLTVNVFEILLKEIFLQNVTGFQWIGTESWISTKNPAMLQYYKIMNGAIGLSVSTAVIPGLKEFLISVHPSPLPGNSGLNEYWEYLFNCTLYLKNVETSNAVCTGQEPLSKINNQYTDVSNIGYTNNVYKATYAVAYSLHNLLGCNHIESMNICINKSNKGPLQVPRSVCSESCQPGTRKAMQKGRPVCCYDCIICAEGEISNITEALKPLCNLWRKTEPPMFFQDGDIIIGGIFTFHDSPADPNLTFKTMPEVSCKGTVPSDDYQSVAMAQLAKHFGWTWVGAIRNDDDYGNYGMTTFVEVARKEGICVEYSEVIDRTYPREKILRVVDVIKLSSSKVIIAFLTVNVFEILLKEIFLQNVTGYQWIGTESWISTKNSAILPYYKIMNGAIGLSVSNAVMPGLKEFLFSVRPSLLPGNSGLNEYWEYLFNCTLYLKNTERGNFSCTGQESLAEINNQYTDMSNLGYTNDVYKAAYAVAYSLHNLLGCSHTESKSTCVNKSTNVQLQLSHYLKTINFTTKSGENFYFDENGDPAAKGKIYDIVNWQLNKEGDVDFVTVGAYYTLSSEGYEFQINYDFINFAGTKNKVPRSVCSESCLPGTRKAVKKGRPICCYDCIPCAEDEINNTTGVSYSASCSCLSDKKLFPYFFRTAPSDYYQSVAMAQLAKHFGWTWVGAIRNDDDYGNYGMATFVEVAEKEGICVEYSEAIHRTYPRERILRVVDIIKLSSSKVIIAFLTVNVFEILLKEIFLQNVTGFQWIGTESWISTKNSAMLQYYKIMNGAIGLSVSTAVIPGLKEFLLSVHPSPLPGNSGLNEYWEYLFNCTLNLKNAETGNSFCTGQESFGEINNQYTDMSNLGYTNDVYKAMYAVAYSLHNLLGCSHTESRSACSNKSTNIQLQLAHYLKTINFTTKSGENVYFDKNGDPAAKGKIYDIVNWQLNKEGDVDFVTVGAYYAFSSEGYEFQINYESINFAGTKYKVPRSVCSESCLPGTRKAVKKGRPICCYDCIPCAEDQISNTTDSSDCLKCPADYKPNRQKDECVLKEIEYLSFQEIMGILLVTLSVLGALLTLLVGLVFYRHRETPIVRANNSELSFLLLFSLTLCFLCSLTFIGQPSDWSCMLRHTAFGIAFVMCISCVLGKTIVVLMAFRSTLPGSNVMKCLSFRELQFAQAMIFAIEEINNNSNLLPGIQLGYKIYDDCRDILLAIKAAMTLLSGHNKELINDRACIKPSIASAIIGPSNSATTVAVATTLASFNIPLISHGASCACLSDKKLFPAFLRTIPSDYYQSRALVQLVKHFGWTWVGAIRSDDDYGNYGMATFEQIAQQEGVCIEYSETIYRTYPREKFRRTVNTIKSSSSNVIIGFVNFYDLEVLLEEMYLKNVTGFQWIGSDSWISARNPSMMEYYKLLKGAIGVQVSDAIIPGLKEFLLNVRPSNIPGNSGMNTYWEFLFNCTTSSQDGTATFLPCTGTENLGAVNTQYTDMSNNGYSGNAYKAMYAIAYSLHNLLKCNSPEQIASKRCSNRTSVEPLQVSHGASCACLSNKKIFPTVLRTIPSDYHQSRALVQLVKHFGWTWVGAIRSDNDYGNYGMAEFINIAQQEGVCIEYSEAIFRTYPRKKFLTVVDIIKSSTSKVIIAFVSFNDLEILLKELFLQNVTGLQWIGTESWISARNPSIVEYYRIMSGALGTAASSTIIPGLKEFLVNVRPSSTPGNTGLNKYWEFLFNCTPFSLNFRELQNAQTMIFAIEEINNRTDILPGVTLGFKIYDSCRDVRLAIKSAMALVSHGASCACLSDKKLFPTFFRTIPSDYYQSRVLVQLVKHFGWTWVGAIRSDNDYGNYGMSTFEEIAQQEGVCIEYSEAIYKSYPRERYLKVVDIIKKSTSKVIIAFVSFNDLEILLREMFLQNVTGFQWIGTDSWISAKNPSILEYYKIMSGAIGTTVSNAFIPGLKNFLLNVRPSDTPGNTGMTEYWEFLFSCSTTKQNQTTRLPPCTGSENLSGLDNQYTDLSNIGKANNVYKATYAVAYSLHNLLACNTKDLNKTCSKNFKIEPLQYLKTVNYTTSNGENVFFDENGDPAARVKTYDLINWQLSKDGMVEFLTFGAYYAFLSEGQQFVINYDSIVWTGADNKLMQFLKSVNFSTSYGENFYFDANGDPAAKGKTYDLINWQLNRDGMIEFVTVGEYYAFLSEGKFVINYNNIVWAGPKRNEIGFSIIIDDREPCPTGTPGEGKDRERGSIFHETQEGTCPGLYGGHRACKLNPTGYHGLEDSRAMDCSTSATPGSVAGTGNSLNFRELQCTQTMIFAIEEINNRTDILPGINLGYKIYDSCRDVRLALQAAMALVNGQEDGQMDGCNEQSRAPVIVGQTNSSPVIGFTTALSPFNIPAISHGASCSCLSNKNLYPTFFRTIASDYYQSRALVQLVKHFGWTWVGAIRSDTDYGNYGMATFVQIAQKEGVCIEYSEAIYRTYPKEKFIKIVDIIKKSTSKVIVAFVSFSDLEYLLNELFNQNVTGYQWIGTESWISARNPTFVKYYKLLSGAIGTAVSSAVIPGLQEFLLNVRPSNNPGNTGLNSFWEFLFNCSLSKQNNADLPPCTGSESLSNINNQYTDLSNNGYSSDVYKATYAVAYALHNLLSCQDEKRPAANGTCSVKMPIDPSQVLNYLKSINFSTSYEENFYFDGNGDPAAKGKTYDLVNWQLNGDGTIEFVTVGEYYAFLSEGKFVIDYNNIVWAGSKRNEVSHAASCACLSNKNLYPTFFRTTPTDYYQSRALVQLVKHFGWTWVGAIRSDTDYGNSGMATFEQTAQNEGVCIEYSEAIYRTYPKEKFIKIADIIKKSTSKVIVAFVSFSDLEYLLNELFNQNVTGHQWIGTQSWISAKNPTIVKYYKLLNGAIGTAISTAVIPGLHEFLLNVRPSMVPGNTGMNSFWEFLFNCSLSKQTNAKLSACTGSESLHNIRNHYGENFYFNANGDPAAKGKAYDLVNWQLNGDGMIEFVTVGEYYAFLSEGTFVINYDNIVWAGSKRNEVPKSVCSESCRPGTRKAVQKGRPICCFDCIPCAEGEISNKSVFIVLAVREGFVPAEFECCSKHRLNFRELQCAQSMIFAIEQINNQTDILPGVTLGYKVYDSCRDVRLALKMAMALVSGLEEGQSDNKPCGKPSNVLAIIGQPNSSPVIGFTTALGPFNIPAISHGASCACLSNKNLYPTFFRTIPSDYYQSKALVQLVKHFGWTWVGALRSDTDYGNYGMATFLQMAQQEGICIEYSEAVYRTYPRQKFLKIVDIIKRSTSKVIVAFVSFSDLEYLLNELFSQNVTGYQWIGTESWISARNPAYMKYYKLLNGAIGTSLRGSVISGLKDFLVNVCPSDIPGNTGMNEFWEFLFNCTLSKQDNVVMLPKCKESEDLKEVNTPYTDLSNNGFCTNAYKATYAVAYALHNLLGCHRLETTLTNKPCAENMMIEPQQVNYMYP
ncbi:V2R1 protein, partial [Polypterus senegalus]